MCHRTNCLRYYAQRRLGDAFFNETAMFWTRWQALLMFGFLFAAAAVHWHLHQTAVACVASVSALVLHVRTSTVPELLCALKSLRGAGGVSNELRASGMVKHVQCAIVFVVCARTMRV